MSNILQAGLHINKQQFFLIIFAIYIFVFFSSVSSWEFWRIHKSKWKHFTSTGRSRLVYCPSSFCCRTLAFLPILATPIKIFWLFHWSCGKDENFLRKLQNSCEELVETTKSKVKKILYTAFKVFSVHFLKPYNLFFFYNTFQPILWFSAQQSTSQKELSGKEEHMPQTSTYKHSDIDKKKNISLFPNSTQEPQGLCVTQHKTGQDPLQKETFVGTWKPLLP